MMYDIEKVRADFPILSREVYKRPLVYLDNGATTQKPLCVLDAMREEYLNVNANVHRGVHYLSQQATDLHEAARERVRLFVNARKTEEIVFTRGTTESINLVASSFCEALMKEGDEVLVSDMEHHSNIVPWQLQAQRRGIVVRHLPITDDGRLDLSQLPTLLTERTRLVSITHVSNVLGTVNPIADIIRQAHERGIPVLVDGAQGAPHQRVDVQQLDCDFYAFSGHKMYGPTGIGVLYGKEEWLDRLPPYQGGGEMIDRVTWEKTTFERLPFKFEAGTPDYVATHGLATAIDYMERLGMENIVAHEHDLIGYALERLAEVPDIRWPTRARRRGELQRGQHPPPRHRHPARPPRHRRPHRPPLRTAADGPTGRSGHRARLLCALQHTSGGGRTGGRTHPREPNVLRHLQHWRLKSADFR